MKRVHSRLAPASALSDWLHNVVLGWHEGILASRLSSDTDNYCFAISGRGNVRVRDFFA